MVKNILIFNPKELPFGLLSNNSIHFMEIDGKKWRSVTNYIYSNMIPYPFSNSNVLQNVDIKDIQKTYDDFKREKYLNIIKNAIEKAVEEKVKISVEKIKEYNNIQFKEGNFKSLKPDLQQLLLSTGNRPIIFISNDKFLGDGEDNDGLNLLGKQLMQLRHQLKIINWQQKIIQKEEEKKKLLYKSYKLEIALENAISKDNDLTEYIGNNKIDIILKNLENMDYLAREIISYDEFVEEILNKNRLSPETESLLLLAEEYPDTLIYKIRKYKLRNLKYIQEKKHRELVFNMYLNYMIRKNYGHINENDYEKVKNQTFSILSQKEKLNLVNKLWNLFLENKLDFTLTNNIKQNLDKIKVPNEEEIREAENKDPLEGYISKKQKQEEKEEEKEQEKEQEEKNPVLIKGKDVSSLNKEQEEFLVFLPSNSLFLFTLDNLLFPTIYHYILFKLIQSIPNNENSYQYILQRNSRLFDLIPNIWEKYNDLENEYNKKYFTIYASKALENKFNDLSLQNLLLVTGNANLIWDDKSNSILGVGKNNKGNNFVGKKLMELRKQIQNNEQMYTNITSSEINQIAITISDSPFMERWLSMRIKDICRSVNIMLNYTQIKLGNDIVLTYKFVESVLNNIYNPCSSIFVRAKRLEDNIYIPGYFKNLVYSCKNFRNVDEDIIKLLWSRIIVMLQTLFEYNHINNMMDISQTIASIQLLLSNKEKCKREQQVEEEEDNCIISALYNVLLGISKFNKDNEILFNGDSYDFDTAVSIILGGKETYPKDVYPKFKPTKLNLSREEIAFEKAQYENNKKNWEEERKKKEKKKGNEKGKKKSRYDVQQTKREQELKNQQLRKRILEKAKQNKSKI